MGLLLRAQDLDLSKAYRPVVTGLPDGVTAELRPWRRGQDYVPVLLHAKRETPMGAAALGFSVSKGSKGEAAPKSAFRAFEALVRVENDNPYVVSGMTELPLGVAGALPFSIKVKSPGVPMVQGGPVDLQVELTRAKGFDGEVRLRLLHEPPGIEGGEPRIGAKENKATLRVESSERVATGRWPVVVMATSSMGGGEVATCSEFIDLEVVRPLLKASLGKARSVRGSNCEMRVVFERLEDIDVELKPRFEGLPRGITMKVPAIRSTQREVVVPVTLDPRAALGRHRRLRFAVDVPSERGMLRHLFRGGELRVDRGAKNQASGGAKKSANAERGSLTHPKT